MDAALSRADWWRGKRVLVTGCAWDLEKAVDRTIQWYRDVIGGASDLALSERQIDEHVADVGADLTTSLP